MDKNPSEEIIYEITEENPAYRGESDGESNWLVSYADMMTLLCGFFIMLFSISKIDQKKYDSVKKSVAEQFHGKIEIENLELKKNLKEMIETKDLGKFVNIESIQGGVALIFQSTTFFESGSAELTPAALQPLKTFANEILSLEKKNQKKYRIQVEGHSDHRKISSAQFPSNWELSSGRAARVVRFLINEGFSGEKMTALGFADTKPIQIPRDLASEDDPAHERNRRVVIQILNE